MTAEQILTELYEGYPDGNNWDLAKTKIEQYKDECLKEALHKYSGFLEHNGYLDSDWWSENPNAVDRFIKSKLKSK